MTSRLSTLTFAALALAAAGAPLLPRPEATPSSSAASWPAAFEGRKLLPLPPAAEDRALARGFPGRVARFSDGRRQIVLRRLDSATRRLHPASDCYRSIGYAIGRAPMRLVAGEGPASCFIARRDGRAFLVCEQVRDPEGSSWPDISSWYWAALLGASRGPWLASLTVERIAA
ncbi:MAG TPA: hypothetical protein VD846_12830 [Allosphingosinicella sp.]|nr:hypothetical protein [Allosphingosinicella sp.]